MDKQQTVLIADDEAQIREILRIYFEKEGFKVVDDELYFNEIPLMDIIKQYGTPLKISYLPKISSQIQKAKRLFNVAIAKADYKGTYTYCYCTKSSHFSFVLEEALKNDNFKELYEYGFLLRNSEIFLSYEKSIIYLNESVEFFEKICIHIY